MLDFRRHVVVVLRARAATLCVAFLTAVIALTSAQVDPAAQAGSWPRNDATWTLDLVKLAGVEPEDPTWIELASPGSTATLGLRITSMATLSQPVSGFTDIQVRYLVHGQPVSDWLPTPFSFTLAIGNTALDSLPDGVHDISVDVMGPTRNDYKPRPIFLYLSRGRTATPIVPLLSRECTYCDYGADLGPGVFYVDPTGHRPHGHPVSPDVTPWHDLPYLADLYQEEMGPHTDHFQVEQMWWEHPTSGRVYGRAFPSKTSEDHRDLRTTYHHDRMPYKDGPRGVAWSSPYVSGQVDAHGGFAFAEVGGPIRYMKPDGEVITVAGWRVKPGREPIWFGRSLDVVRQNMELRGTWTEGQYPGAEAGMHTPLDVALDPLNDDIWYVPGYEDNVIWKVQITAEDYSAATVSVFAGDPGHAAGFQNGTGHAARFRGPASIVFDPICDCMYVADQDNDAIRRISRSGVVTTLFGSPGMAGRLIAAGVTTTDQYAVQAENQKHAMYTVSPLQAAAGIRPDIYLPQTVRVDSQGKIILLEIGFGSIRQIDPVTGQARHIVDVRQRFESNFGGTGRGWAWLDVDRFGNSGPLDGIYYCAFQASWIDGEAEHHTNEAFGWVPITGAPAHFLFNDWEAYPDGWGRRSETDPPHYAWLVAVDPRGGVFLGGGGEHGLTRLRMRRPSDPVPQDYFDYDLGKKIFMTISWLPGLVYAPSPAIKFGSEAHNYLGFADAYDYKDATDSELITAFELPTELTSSPGYLKSVLNFLRLSGGKQIDGYVPPIIVNPGPPTVPPTPPDGSGSSSSSGSSGSSGSPGSNPGGCLTADPFFALGGGTCVNGGWLPPGFPGLSTSSSSSGSSGSSGSNSGGCVGPDPFLALGGGVCVNGGWLPAGMVGASVGSSSGGGLSSTGLGSPGISSGASSTGGSSGSSGGCQTSDPFASLGGGTCLNGGWLPPGFPGVSSSSSSSGSSSAGGSSSGSGPGISSGASSTGGSSGSSGGCQTSDPFASLGGGTCMNGGWLPPGFPGVSSSSSSSGSSSGSGSSGGGTQGGCTTPDPFRSLPGVVGLCANGGWLPIRVGG